MESKKSQHFVDSSGQEFHPLEFFADRDFYSSDFLKAAVGGGKLKAFRLGDDWLTTSEWVDDFKRKIKRQIEQEIISTSSVKNWINYLPLRRSSEEVFDFSLSSVVVVFFCVWLGFLMLAFHLAYPNQLPLNSQQLARGCWRLAVNVAETNNYFWSAPLKFVPKSPLFSDEKITQSWHEFVRRQEPSLPPAGQVAGAKDKIPGSWR